MSRDTKVESALRGRVTEHGETPRTELKPEGLRNHRPRVSLAQGDRFAPREHENAVSGATVEPLNTVDGASRFPTKGGKRIVAWVQGVAFDQKVLAHLHRLAALPIVPDRVVAMPDIHLGRGTSVGTVIPTLNAIIPAAVGTDIGCGMMAVRTTLRAEQLPDNLDPLRAAIEGAVPHGTGRKHGMWKSVPGRVASAWKQLAPGFACLSTGQRSIANGPTAEHLGTLGSGNHFIEVCLDESDRVWVMLHSGSRGVGKRIGERFIELAKQDMRAHVRDAPNDSLAYLREGTEHFDAYVQAMTWAQTYASANRDLLMQRTLQTMVRSGLVPHFGLDTEAINVHHNYVSLETHDGQDLWITRKGAVRAGEGELGIIPGSMGARSYIVRGKGNKESFESSSHGAGRVVSRSVAKRVFSVEDHMRTTEGISSRKDAGVLDETPLAYKPIDAVMDAQQDLVEPVHVLRQVLNVKG